MKNISLVSAILSLSVLQVANAADGMINFTGNITGTACVVDTTSVAVDLGTVSASAFSGGAGTTAAAKRFNIVLKSCPASISSASIRFDGTTNTINPSILALSTGEPASNVGVAIYEQDNATLIPIGSASADVALLADVNNTLTYFAKYMSTGTTVGVGSARSSTAFTVTYQ
ncbi:fimbrial protein [[Enterobacter] lignolyticus]|nr:fimbrial protein [[Enterobacter] lignolyticus]